MTGVWLHVCSVLNLAYCCVLAPIHQKQKSCVSAPEGSGLLELGRSRYALHRTWWKLTHTLKWNLSAGGWVPVSSAALLWGRAWIEPVHLFQKISRPTVQRKMLKKKKNHFNSITLVWRLSDPKIQITNQNLINCTALRHILQYLGCHYTENFTRTKILHTYHVLMKSVSDVN